MSIIQKRLHHTPNGMRWGKNGFRLKKNVLLFRLCCEIVRRYNERQKCWKRDITIAMEYGETEMNEDNSNSNNKKPKTLNTETQTHDLPKIRNINHGRNCAMKHVCDHKNNANKSFILKMKTERKKIKF